MPIAQDRLIKLVANADTLLETVEEMRKNTKDNVDFTRISSISNSVIEHSEDNNAKEVVRELLETIRRIYWGIMTVEISADVKNNITEERLHFKVHRKANAALANYMRYKRNADANMKASQLQVPQFFISEDKNAPDEKVHKDIQEIVKDRFKVSPVSEDDPHYKAFLEGKTLEPGAGESNESSDQERIERRKRIREAEKIEVERILAEQEIKKQEDELALKKRNGKTYDKDVISTSVPSDEELYKPDIPDGMPVI